MADMFSREKRSKIMSAIRSENSVAELIVFKYLRKQQIYFQKHYSKAPGKPDIALPRKKVAVFIDGDFWHGRDYSRIVRTRDPEDYWVQKIAKNIQRDNNNKSILESKGWRVLNIWESDIKRKRTREEALTKISRFLNSA